jgi:hypothetical protein
VRVVRLWLWCRRGLTVYCAVTGVGPTLQILKSCRLSGERGATG